MSVDKPFLISSIKDKVITPDTLILVGDIPAVKGVEIFPHGTIRGNAISLGDKPAGQEAGMLFYARDKQYYDALREVTPLIKLGATNIEDTYKEALDTVYKQFIDNYHR